MSIGLVRVPFLSMINFSTMLGNGLNGARSIRTANMMRIAYGRLLSVETAERCNNLNSISLTSAYVAGGHKARLDRYRNNMKHFD